MSKVVFDGTPVARAGDATAPQVRERRWTSPSAVVPVLLVAVWTALNIWWSLSRLDDRALNIDEAGYLAIAANHAYGFAVDGVGGWLDSVLATSQHAPGVPSLTSLLIIAGMELETAGLTVVGLSAGVLLLFTWLIVREVGPTEGRIAVVLLATTPGVLNYSHIYTFVLPTAALLAVALYAVYSARCASGLRWIIVLGLVLGCLPLVRSMNFAFAGIIGLIVLSQALLTPGSRLKAVRNVAVAALLAAGTLVPWLWSSWRLVVEYLFGFGYGDRAAEYDMGGSSVLAAVRRTAAVDLYAIHSTIILAGVLAAALVEAVATWRRLRTPDNLRAPWTSFANGPLYPAIALSAGGFAALGTTANAGSGFGLQLAPAFVTVACFGWGRLLGLPAVATRPVVRPIVVGALALACAVPAVGLLMRTAPLGTDRMTALPVLGHVRLTGGEKLDESYLAIANGEGPTNRPEWSDDWRAASDKLAAAVAQDDLAASSVAFGFRGYFVNANTLQLEVLRNGHWAVPVVQIEPTVVENSENAYLEWLTRGAAATVCQLATSSGEVNEFRPMVDMSLMESAAHAAGFERTESIGTPDGRSIGLWRRDTADCRG